MGWLSGKGQDKGQPEKHYYGASEVTRDSNGKVITQVSVGERGYIHKTPSGSTTGHSNGVSHHHGGHVKSGKEYSGSGGGSSPSGGILGSFFGGGKGK